MIKTGKCTPSSTTFSWFIADGVKEMRYYEKIDGSKYRNIWVVGDLHGCYTNLMNKLDTIGFDNKKDLLISVGDLVDRGAENVECLELITFPWFRAVRGNHEQMMIDGLSERGTLITGCLMAVAGSLISITTKKFWLQPCP
jgi:serine/threonine protein phosphatase 1